MKGLNPKPCSHNIIGLPLFSGSNFTPLNNTRIPGTPGLHRKYSRIMGVPIQNCTGDGNHVEFVLVL